jgi:CheY-like chemotaxis protein
MNGQYGWEQRRMMSKDTNKMVVYSALEVANICGVVNQTAINWIRNDYLKAFSTPGGQYRVYQDDLVEFMKKRKMRIPSELLEESATECTPDTILIVDDDKGLNTVIAKYVAREFPVFQVLQAFDGFEAGAQMVDKRPANIVLDLDLPGINGFDLCKRINETGEFGSPRVFVITALQDEDLEERVKQMGAAKFFRKPINLKELAEAIKASVEA